MDYPHIIAHRCGGALAPENTLAGLRIAARMGCRGVEFDVMLTADGVPILMHDETLERTTSGEGPVAATPAATIARLDAGSKHHRAFAVEPAPTFQAALQLCATLGLWANVEIKPSVGAEAETGRVVADVVAAHLADGCAAAIVLSSFSAVALQQALRRAPAVPRALLTENIPADWRERLAAVGAQALHTAASAVNPERLAPICNAGMRIACYTVNDRASANSLFAQGVCAVFSDRIDLWQPEEM
jgi:glycerophosphoryl diester phosphodiesterase